MARAPQSEDAFFREVDDEVRRDRLMGFWQRYGRTALIALAIALVALAAWLYWQHRREAQAGAQGEALSQALGDAGTNPKAAAPKLAAIAASGDGGYAIAARLAQAGLAGANGDVKGAAAGFARVAADARAPQAFRDLALIRQTALEFDTLPPATVVSRMLPYAVAGNPWFGSAAEMAGVAYLKQNKPADAGRMFAALARERTVPDTIRARAVRIAGMLGVEVDAVREGTTAR